jgi:hypothetical protein
VAGEGCTDPDGGIGGPGGGCVVGRGGIGGIGGPVGGCVVGRGGIGGPGIGGGNDPGRGNDPGAGAVGSAGDGPIDGEAPGGSATPGAETTGPGGTPGSGGLAGGDTGGPGGEPGDVTGTVGRLFRQSWAPISEMLRFTGSRIGRGAGVMPAAVRALSRGSSSWAENASTTPPPFWDSTGSRAASSATLDRSTLTPTLAFASPTCPYWSSSSVGLAGLGLRHL